MCLIRGSAEVKHTKMKSIKLVKKLMSNKQQPTRGPWLQGVSVRLAGAATSDFILPDKLQLIKINQPTHATFIYV